VSCYQHDAEVLRASGHRLTPQRLMVLEALYHHPGHATAEEIWARVRERHPYVDLSTVYRALQFLKGQGLVGELRTAGEPAQYEAVQRRPHAHAVCRACGKVLEVPITWLAELVSELAREHGFQADVGHLDIPGLCAHCVGQEHAL